jgi:hypothetical protein
VMISQGTEYTMQKRLKLFGPASEAFFPLQTPYRTCSPGGHRTREELVWCKLVIADISKCGYGLRSFFIRG